MVYYCSVKGCKNNSKMKKKDPNIVLSFHAFPVKEATKQKWLRAIGRPSWKPPSFARICSAHFDFDQISHEGCRIRMMDDACPVNGLPPNSNFEASNVEVCRICLATDLKMFSLQDGLLNTCVLSLAGLKENCSIEGLPQFVCYECSARLINCYNLIGQSSIAQAVLLDLFTKNGQVSKCLVQKQDRKSLGLESSLQCYNTTKTHEYTFKDEYPNENHSNALNKIEINASKNADASEDRLLEKNLLVRSQIEKGISKDDYDHRRLTVDIKTNRYKRAAKSAQGVTKLVDDPTPHRVGKRNGSIESGVTNFDESDDSANETQMVDYDDEKVERKIEICKEKCPVCHLRFKTDALVKTHVKRYHDRKYKFCTKTLFNVASERGMKLHIKAAHNDLEKSNNADRLKYPCEECDTNFASEEARRVHLLTSKQHRKKPDLCDPAPTNPVKACSKCGSLFPNTRELVSHTRSEHPRPKRSLRRKDGYPVKCEHCEEMIASRWQHWLHVRRKHPDKKHLYRAEHNSVCQRCGKQFQNATKLRMHELRHGPATFRCGSGACARAFHDKYALARHARTHASHATHACAQCARAFRDKHNLLRHQRVHTGETPYGCELCGKRFKHSTSQRHHVRSVHYNLPAQKRNKLAVEVDSN